MYLNRRIYKILTLITAILLIAALPFSLASCNVIKDYEERWIPYEDYEFYAGTNTILAIIKSREELENYFSQENYIKKGKDYEREADKLNEEFFNEYVLIAATYSDNAKLTIKKSKDTIKLIYKHRRGTLLASMPTLQFLQIPVKFVGDATKIVREDI